MVNQNQNKVYTPRAVYNRKMLRDVLRHEAAHKYGQHNVSKIVHDAFENIKNERNKEEVE